MSVQQLSDAVERFGVKIQRPVLANLETGRRPTISVAELFALAAALEVPPLLLVFPVGKVDLMEPLPGIEVSPFAALSWAEHGRIADVTDPDLENATLIQRWREHERLLSEWIRARREARRLRDMAEAARAAGPDAPDDPAELLRDAEDWEREQRRAADQLRPMRRGLVQLGVKPPILPVPLLYLDEELDVAPDVRKSSAEKEGKEGK